MKKKTKPAKGSWIVRMQCVVTKDVYCENCTEEQARSNPFDYASDEREVDQIDWEIRSVQENA